MRRRIFGVVTVLAVVWLVNDRANAAADVTVQGEVVEIACSISKGAGGRGLAHATCALDGAKRGQPLAVLADDGVYELTGDFAANRNAKLLDFVAKPVTVTGELSEIEGRKRLNVRTIRVN
jgi:hypothetical protein